MSIETIIAVKPDETDLRKMEGDIEKSLDKVSKRFNKKFFRDFANGAKKAGKTLAIGGGIAGGIVAGGVALLKKQQEQGLGGVTEVQKQAEQEVTVARLSGGLASLGEVKELVQGFQKQGFSFDESINNIANIIDKLQGAQLGVDRQLINFTQTAQNQGIVRAIDDIVKNLQNQPVSISQRQGAGLFDANPVANARLLAQSGGLPTTAVAQPDVEATRLVAEGATRLAQANEVNAIEARGEREQAIITPQVNARGEKIDIVDSQISANQVLLQSITENVKRSVELIDAQIAVNELEKQTASLVSGLVSKASVIISDLEKFIDNIKAGGIVKTITKTIVDNLRGGERPTTRQKNK